MQLVRRFLFILLTPLAGFAQTTFSCPANQYVSTQLVNTGQACSAMPTTVTNVTGATSGGLVVSTTNPTSAPVVSVAPDATHYLPSTTDQTNWNSKQSAGSYLTGLTGDVTATGPGAASVVVTKINGGAISTSGAIQKTNGSGQMVNAASGTDYAIPAQIPFANNPVAGASAQYPMLDGVGTTVTDISGNGNHASFGAGAASPSWYSYGVALLDTGASVGPIQYITTPLTSWKTAVVEYCTPTLVQTTGTSTGGVPANDYPALVGPLPGSGTGLAWFGVNIAQLTVNTFTPSIFIYGSNANPTVAPDGTAGCHVEAVTLDTVDHLFLDGKEVTNYSAQGASALSAGLSSGTYLIGPGTRGVVAYAIFYPTARTSAEVLSISAFVQSQMSRRVAFPKYPYRSNSRSAQAIFVGDSLTATYLGSSAWTASLALTRSYTVTNYGIGGMTAYDMCKMSDQRWVQSIVPGQSTIALWGGTNDVSQDGRTPQDVWASISSCVAKAHSYGARIIVSTMTGRTSQDINKNGLNALIRSGCPQIGCDYVNDVAEVPALGADAATPNAACFQDTVHMTGPGAGTCATVSGVALSGYGVIAALNSNAINTLDGSTQAAPDISTSTAYVETYANNYVIQTATAAATHKLVDLSGQTSPRVIVNGSATFSITVTTSGSQSIVGGAVIPPGATGTFVPILTSATTGGGYWSSKVASVGSGGALQVNGAALASATTVNYRTGSGNAGVVVTNASAGNVDFNLSLPLAGAGAGIPTGPTSGTVANDIACYSTTTGQMIDCGIAKISLVQTTQSNTYGNTTQSFRGISFGAVTFSVASGCGTTTTLKGGNQGGSFVAGQAACAAVITTGLTTTNGYTCWANDLTTPANAVRQVATSTTTATLSGTVVAGDVINFGCMAY